MAGFPASGKPVPGCSPTSFTKEGFRPAHRMVDGTEPCTSKEEWFSPTFLQVPATVAIKKGGGVQLRGPRKHSANPVILQMREPSSSYTVTMFSHIHSHDKGWRFCSGLIFPVSFSFLFLLSGWERNGQAIFGVPSKEDADTGHSGASPLKLSGRPLDPGGRGLGALFRNTPPPMPENSPFIAYSFSPKLKACPSHSPS